MGYYQFEFLFYPVNRDDWLLPVRVLLLPRELISQEYGLVWKSIKSRVMFLYKFSSLMLTLHLENELYSIVELSAVLVFWVDIYWYCRLIGMTRRSVFRQLLLLLGISMPFILPCCLTRQVMACNFIRGRLVAVLKKGRPQKMLVWLLHGVPRSWTWCSYSNLAKASDCIISNILFILLVMINGGRSSALKHV